MTSEIMLEVASESDIVKTNFGDTYEISRVDFDSKIIYLIDPESEDGSEIILQGHWDCTFYDCKKKSFNKGI